MAVDFRRVFLIALALGVGGALVGVRLLRPQSRVDVETAPESRVPVLDASDPAIRRVLARVAAKDEATSHLYRTCSSELPDRIRMATMPGHRPGARQRELLVTRRGEGASLEYFDRAFPPTYEVSDTVYRKASIDGAEWGVLAKLFADAGYPNRIEPSDGDLCVDGGWRRIESCLGGRYYAAFRGCDASSLDRLADGAFAFARAKVSAKGRDVPPRPITFAGEFLSNHHGALVSPYESNESFVLVVPHRLAADANIERLFAMSYEARREGKVVRGRFAGLLMGPEGMGWFELQSVEDLQLVEE